MKVKLARIDLWKMGNELNPSYNKITLKTVGGMVITVPVSEKFFSKLEHLILSDMKNDIQAQITTAIEGTEQKEYYKLDL